MLELERLDQSIKDEQARHAVPMTERLAPPLYPKSQIKRHFDEVPDEPVDTTF